MTFFDKSQIRTESDGATAIDWTIPEDLFYFDGHFPHNPVLPAVAIVDLSFALIKSARPDIVDSLKAVPSAKFSQPLRPQNSVRIIARSKSSNEWNIDWMDTSSLEVSAQIRIITSGV